MSILQNDIDVGLETPFCGTMIVMSVSGPECLNEDKQRRMFRIQHNLGYEDIRMSIQSRIIQFTKGKLAAQFMNLQTWSDLANSIMEIRPGYIMTFSSYPRWGRPCLEVNVKRYGHRKKNTTYRCFGVQIVADKKNEDLATLIFDHMRLTPGYPSFTFDEHGNLN